MGNASRKSNKPRGVLSGKDLSGGHELVEPHLVTRHGLGIGWSSPVELYKSSKQKSRDSPDHPRKEETSKRACWKRKSGYLREIERDQALVEKEELKATLVESRIKEVEAKDQLGQLQERVCLLDAEFVKNKLRDEYLGN
ncbi:hypothetical protein CR513_23259, partial [Mucuna pruriens]